MPSCAARKITFITELPRLQHPEVLGLCPGSFPRTICSIDTSGFEEKVSKGEMEKAVLRARGW